MSPVDALRIALRSILTNGLRSFLTALGMVIGVGSVIVLIAVGQGAQKGIQEQIRSLGTDLLFITPGVSETQGGGPGGAFGSATLTLEDAELLEEAGIIGLQGVAPELSLDVQGISDDGNVGVTLVGTTSDYLTVREESLAAGGFISDLNVERTELVAVLGSEAAETLYPNGDAIGQTVRVAIAGGRLNLNYTVIGVMAPNGSADAEQDTFVFVPITSILSRIGFARGAGGTGGGTPVNQINVRTTPDADKAAVSRQIESVLAFEHGVAEPDFVVQTQDDLLGAAGDVGTTLSILLGSIAAISLVVGGIGVMNIMLVSVTERTREIGIRRAVGARRSDIMVQFVTEALALCIGGGAIGIAIGMGVAEFLDGRIIAGSEMATIIQPWSVFAAFAVAAGIGLAAGTYPALRASKLDPIDALRAD